MEIRDRLFINGAWLAPTSPGTIDVFEAGTGEVLGRVPEGTPQDIDRAVSAARSAFPSWSATPVEERLKLLTAVAEGLQRRRDEIATMIAREVGMPLALSYRFQADWGIGIFASMAQLADEFFREEKLGNSLVEREPVGVVGGITAWNYPLMLVASKTAPALAAGCTVVIKPSELAPYTAFVLADVFEEIGLPPGVVNIVTGFGEVVGEALVSHPDVDMISFTGSSRAGKRVAELAAQTVKRVSLELGGKSPNVILDDADLTKAVPDGVMKAYLNSGQTCAALTRMIVPRSKLAEVEAIATETANSFTVGDPIAEDTTLGPLVSRKQLERVRDYIRKGIEEGAKLLTGGVESPKKLKKGYFVAPTIFSDVRSDMTIAQEEIFGPVLCILPYDTEDDAVRIANDSAYGLYGGVWSADAERAKRVARQIRTGQVEINGATLNIMAPFGGYKQSGNGSREWGKYGVEEFFEVKAIHL